MMKVLHKIMPLGFNGTSINIWTTIARPSCISNTSNQFFVQCKMHIHYIWILVTPKYLEFPIDYGHNVNPKLILYVYILCSHPRKKNEVNEIVKQSNLFSLHGEQGIKRYRSYDCHTCNNFVG
jgi:hypothetical protein